MRFFILLLLFFVGIGSVRAGGVAQARCNHGDAYVCDYCPDAYLYMSPMERYLEQVLIEQRINLLVFWLHYNGFLEECVSPPELVLKDQRFARLESIRQEIMYLSVCERKKNSYTWSRSYRCSLLSKLNKLKHSKQ